MEAEMFIADFGMCLRMSPCHKISKAQNCRSSQPPSPYMDSSRSSLGSLLSTLASLGWLSIYPFSNAGLIQGWEVLLLVLNEDIWLLLETWENADLLKMQVSLLGSVLFVLFIAGWQLEKVLTCKGQWVKGCRLQASLVRLWGKPFIGSTGPSHSLEKGVMWSIGLGKWLSSFNLFSKLEIQPSGCCKCGIQKLSTQRGNKSNCEYDKERGRNWQGWFPWEQT